MGPVPKRERARLLAAALGFVSPWLLAATEAKAAPPGASAPSSASAKAVINGVVKHAKTGAPLENAVVVLQCACLRGQQERMTNARGIYSFTDLPSGNYTIQVLAGKANVSKITQLPRGAKFRANFSLDPDQDQVIEIVVEATPVPTDTSATMTIGMEEGKQLPVGSDTSRDFTAIVEVAPTASRDAAGISLAGTSGAETKYTVEGAEITNPAFGTVGATLIQEFVQDVEIRESGYDAEFGGASGGQVSARRVAGTNTLRGEAGLRFTPRLGDPRIITNTDEALRVTEAGDFNAQGYAVVSGPIKKDKLFFTIGLTPSGTQNSLIQSFYHRVDRDGTGSFEECIYKNGDNDCVPGHNYIATEKFAEQKFRTGVFNFGYIAGLDWAISPRHRLGFTAQGGPSFIRTSYRLPLSFDPNAFGTNLTSNPLSGLSRIATGIVNEHFGTTLTHTTLVALNYAGRAFDDKLEIDVRASFFQSVYEDAWRLDDPNLKNIPATQTIDPSGRNLYEYLDRVGSVGLVPGVDEACNDRAIAGVACPTRTWLSGGIGEYDHDVNRRVAGGFSLTHFFSAAGSHQIKWGGEAAWLQRDSVYTYSGRNDDDFRDNCPAGQLGGGEYCYDPDTDSYAFDKSIRVNNNRFMIVNLDNPNRRSSFGFGRVRHEQGTLNAVADPLGRAARVDAYDEALSTTNYAFFLQDKWAILSNLYLSAGVRWEVQDMRDVFGDQQILIWDNVGPRVGLVYDWTDEGKSRFYASYGWFFQPLPVQLNSRVFGGLVQVVRSFDTSECYGGQTTTVNGVSHPRVDNDDQPTQWCVDFQADVAGSSVGAVVPRLKGQYNRQFQVGYDQEIIEDLVIGFRWLHTDLGRAAEDVSTNGGLNYIIANPGVGVSPSDIAAKQAECAELEQAFADTDTDDDSRYAIARDLNRCQFLAEAYEKVNEDFDRPTRNYDAWTFQLQKRFAKNWLLLASYTYSRLVGNYDGFVNPITGAINLGASVQYDLPVLVVNSFGPLSGNIPHRIKLDGFYSFDLRKAGRLTLGSSFRFQSGIPINVRSGNRWMLPRGAGGRVQPNYSWNISAGYAYPLPRDVEIEFNARVLNVTNAKAVLRVDDNYGGGRPIPGGDLSDLKHAGGRTKARPNDNYGVPIQFQQPISAQFELKVRF